ncbi:MAG TPA: pentapeptide repeat-containing protein [Leifsonia sp.]
MTTIDRGERTDLMADCANCFGLCCVALAFARSSDFAIDKPAGDPCINLEEDFRCGIHPDLRARGFRGCTVFDCFGAGQQVSQRTFGGTSWTDDPGSRDAMFRVFPVVRRLHELLWYLDEASRLSGAESLRPRIAEADRTVRDLCDAAPEQILAADVDALQAPAAALLREASALHRAQRNTNPLARAGADLVDASLAGADLRGAEFRGALLIAADLRGADLSGADLIGADLRDADLSGADLHSAIYLTQPQLNAAAGDATTRIPPGLTRPAHWQR